MIRIRNGRVTAILRRRPGATEVRVAGAWPTACAHELALFRQLAGPEVEVERIAHIQAGDPVCAYVLRAASQHGP